MKHNILRLLLLSLSLALSIKGNADQKGQAFYEKNFDQSNGLCENTVNCILQDKLGYIWMGTWDGLTRYDGNGFTLYKSYPTDKGCTLPSNRISWIVESSKSDIWCIVNEKVYLFRRSNFQFEEVCPKEQLRPIRQIYPQANGKSLLVSTDGTAYEVSDDNPTQVLSKQKVKLGTERAAIYKAYTRDFVYFADAKGNIYYRNIYTNEKGIASKAPGVGMVYGLCQYRRNSILVSTNHGVYVYESPTRLYPLPGWDNQFIRNLCVDRQGNIWMANYPGVTMLSPIKNIIAPRKDAPQQKEEFVRALLKDKEGRIWMADKNGFIRISDKGKTSYLAPNGTLTESKALFGSNVYCIFEDSHNLLWLGTKENGLFRLSPSNGKYTITHYTTATTGLSHNSIYAMAEDARHRLWVGTFGGGLNQIVFDKQGKAMFWNSKNAFKHYPQECNKVRCLYALKDGVMIAGTTRGLLTFSTTESNPTFYHNLQKRQSHSIIGNDVMQIVGNKRGEIYLATFGGGLNLIKSKQLLSSDIHFQQISTTEGLTSSACLTAAFDNKDNLWVISEMTLAKYHKGNPITNFSIRDFGGHFIFSEVQPICANGKMLIGTTQGLLVFLPERLKKSSFAPNIVINQILVEGKERAQDFNIKPSLVMEKDERNLVINFSTLDFNRSMPILYKYKVDGLDGTWKIAKSSSLNLANIPPGQYTLEIISTNGDGMWSSKTRRLSIEVKPQFNETVFAKVLYSILFVLLGIIIIIVAKYIYQLRAQMEEIQLATNEKFEKVSQRIHELMGNKATIEDLQTDVADKIIDKQREFIDKLMEFMNRNIERSDLQVGDIATHMGMSKTLLYTKTKEALNCTPLTLINDLRIKRAVKLLEAGQNVSSVAYSCGYSDPHYFSRCFRKVMGRAPSDYTTKNKGEEA